MTTSALSHFGKADPILAQLIAKCGPIRFPVRKLSPFQSLVHAIIHQQLSGKAAHTIFGRFQSLFGNCTFPSPEQVLSIEVDLLRTAGLSAAKANYVRHIAEHSISGKIPTLAECRRLRDEEITARLITIKGVGRWTAEMFLIFNLGRPDVLPVHDLGVRRGFQTTFKKRKLPEPEKLERYGERWRPYRTTAALYLWRAADFLKDGEW